MEPGANPRAELSSISTALDDLTARIGVIAERTAGTALGWLATDLYEAERALDEARLRLQTVRERLRRD